MSYIGAYPAGYRLQQQVPTVVNFSGNGANTIFTLPVAVSNVNMIEVLVNNVQQNPLGGSYSVSNTSITFSEAPSAGTNNVVIIYRTVTS